MPTCSQAAQHAALQSMLFILYEQQRQHSVYLAPHLPPFCIQDAMAMAAMSDRYLDTVPANRSCGLL
jgi:hypothetical protein